MKAYDFDRAQDFLWRNARLLERQLFIHLFKNGPREAVLTALKAYQNPDGGFPWIVPGPTVDNTVSVTASHITNAKPIACDGQTPPHDWQSGVS